MPHPYVSPLFGDLTGFLPTFLQSGTRGLFLSNAVRLHRLLRRKDLPTELHIFELCRMAALWAERRRISNWRKRRHASSQLTGQIAHPQEGVTLGDDRRAVPPLPLP